MLWPGEFVQAQVIVRTEPQAIAVPSEAVQHGPDGTYVWLVSTDSTVRRQPVQISEIQDSRTIISGGLKTGDRIVVTGQYGLTEGARITETAAAQAGQGQS